MTVLFLFWVLCLSLIDVRVHRLPDQLTLPGAAVAAAWALAHDPTWILGGVGWAGIYLLTGVVVGGIGGGDIKFALGLGIVAASAAPAAWVGAVVGASIVSLAGSRVLRGGRGGEIPHGPGMAIATVVAIAA
ncbi:prepilin peptidase [Corynebacterium pacaense]|uniref:prepilin peptidase n=1 Tax=Corynebacterium pacaense TaxID=1816684 RepID=UPI001FE24A27|nr:prepilin peptidase [Corynebacterium pacaense]